MKKSYSASLLFSLVLGACSSTNGPCAVNDADCDGVPDDIGARVNDSKGNWVRVDINQDGIIDGLAVDTDFDGDIDGVLIDTDGDGLGDSVDTNGDGFADISTQYILDQLGPASGGSPGSGGGQNSSGGAPPASGGSPSSGGAAQTDGCLLSNVSAVPGTTTSERYFETDVTRGNTNYKFIANGWGDGWQSHSLKITTRGTAYEVVSFNGSETGQGVPAGYPTVFCGNYSDKISGECGLSSPKAVSALVSMNTGLKWSHAAGDGKYNIAYDVWMSNGGSTLSGYFMVWFRDPAGAQPAGNKTKAGLTVGSTPGTWDVWAGSVNGRPIVNYVRPESAPTYELSFDMKEFLDHAQANQITLPGTSIISVAVGTEIWSGPVTGLKIEDFCVDVK